MNRDELEEEFRQEIERIQRLHLDPEEYKAAHRKLLKKYLEQEFDKPDPKWMPFKNYRDYMRSPEWQVLRAQVVIRDKGICQECSKTGSHVHHMSYENGPNEEGENLILLCKECHDAIHRRAKWSLNG